MKKYLMLITIIIVSGNLFAQTSPVYTSLAIGANTVASGANSFAAGYSTQSAGLTSIAMGHSIQANAPYSIAMGYSSQTNGQCSIAMGNSSIANGINSMAMGYIAKASAENSIAIGNFASANGKNSLAMGSNLSTNGRTGSFCFGDYAGGSTTLSNPFGNDADNQMLMRFVGGYKFYLDNTKIPFAINSNGTVNIDVNNMNSGTVNTGLVFGFQSGEGIASKRTGGGNQYGLDFYTNFTNRLSITNTGHVSVGTSMNIDQGNTGNSSVSTGLTFGAGSGEGIASNRAGGINQWGLDFYSNSVNRMCITNAGNVGIGITLPAAKLHVAGNIMASGTITPSDIRYKENIVPVNNALDKIMSISGYYYSLKVNEFPDMGFEIKKQIGVIAQEVEEVVPEVVTTLKNGYKTVDYPKLIPLLIQGIKEQQQQIDELKKLVSEKNN